MSAMHAPLAGCIRLLVAPAQVVSPSACALPVVCMMSLHNLSAQRLDLCAEQHQQHPGAMLRPIVLLTGTVQIMDHIYVC